MIRVCVKKKKKKKHTPSMDEEGNPVPRQVIMIGCGAVVDLCEALGVGEDEAIFYVIDAQRPYHLSNVYAPNVYIFDDGAGETREYPPLPEPGSDLVEDGGAFSDDGRASDESVSEYDKADDYSSEDEEEEESAPEYYSSDGGGSSIGVGGGFDLGLGGGGSGGGSDAGGGSGSDAGDNPNDRTIDRTREEGPRRRQRRRRRRTRRRHADAGKKKRARRRSVVESDEDDIFGHGIGYAGAMSGKSSRRGRRGAGGARSARAVLQRYYATTEYGTPVAVLALRATDFFF
jgi:hypothetical protein